MKRLALTCVLLPIAWAAFGAASSPSQTNFASGAAPLPSAVPSSASAPRTFHDPNYKISFDFPSNWNFTRKDREISTFHLDARTAPRNAALRAVAAIPENPYPASTFSGAYVYFSVTPHSNGPSCARQAEPSDSPAKPEIDRIAGIPFAHGHDEQRHICTTDRDEIYTTYRRGACYRFDLAMNNFCGGEVSGVKDITQQELDNVRARMESILATVRFDPK